MCSQGIPFWVVGDAKQARRHAQPQNSGQQCARSVVKVRLAPGARLYPFRQQYSRIGSGH